MKKSLVLGGLFAAAVLAVACGSDPNTLSNGAGVGAGGGGARGGAGGRPTGGNGGSNGGGNGAGAGNTDPNGAPAAQPPASDNQPPPGVTDNKAKAYFVQTVYPSLMATCGACHAPPGSSGAPVYLSKTSATDAYTMNDYEVYSIVKYLRSLPPVTKKVLRSVCPPFKTKEEQQVAAQAQR
jgi:hypothetical protein